MSEQFTASTGVDFFMGANSPDGFFSLYDELRIPQKGVRRFLLKGGAGTGKSSLMRGAVERFSGRDALLERIHCSSDPDSLDGVILHSARASIVDATPPHAIEPEYPGGFETVVNLCEYFDEEKLESRLERIVELQAANGECHRKCRGLLKCADILLRDSASYAAACTDFSKISVLAARIGKKELPARSGSGTEHRRLLSAVTNQGIVTWQNTAAALCDRLYLLRDEYGVSSDALLQQLRLEALVKGYEIFTCRCPLAPSLRLEHLFIPQLRLGFVTQTRCDDLSALRPEKVIHFTRFTNMERLKQKKQRLCFNRKAVAELLDAAVGELCRAKELHDQLEAQYTDAVDFAAVTRKAEQVYKKLTARYYSNSV